MVSVVLQPLHLSTMNHGKHNAFGLGDRTENLVIVLFTAVWKAVTDDTLVNESGSEAIREINQYAEDKGTADQFRYLNWCDGTQRPFESYGEANLHFLQSESRNVDPDGFFQWSCVGGHKLLHEDQR
jgi:hypothetical protein